MLKFKFAMDSNGNKIVKVTRKGFRGFNIQTNGNLPQTHAMNADTINTHIVQDEVRAFCSAYGTFKYL